MPNDTHPPARTHTSRPDDDADGLSRFSVSLPKQLLDDFDRLIHKRQLPSRSRAIADCIRERLMEESLGEQVVAGTVTVVYHGRGHSRQQLANIQQRYLKEVISSLHVFLEDEHSLEVLLVQGPAEKLTTLADELRALRHVKHCRLSVITERLPPVHQ